MGLRCFRGFRVKGFRALGCLRGLGVLGVLGISRVVGLWRLEGLRVLGLVWRLGV